MLITKENFILLLESFPTDYFDIEMILTLEGAILTLDDLEDVRLGVIEKNKAEITVKFSY